MPIYAYNEKTKKTLGIKAKSEPWLHIAVQRVNPQDLRKEQSKLIYAVYVWDTRQVVDSGILKENQYDAHDVTDVPHDTREPLKGSGNEVKTINAKIFGVK